ERPVIDEARAAKGTREHGPLLGGRIAAVAVRPLCHSQKLPHSASGVKRHSSVCYVSGVASRVPTPDPAPRPVGRAEAVEWRCGSVERGGHSAPTGVALTCRLRLWRVRSFEATQRAGCCAPVSLAALPLTSLVAATAWRSTGRIS